jgi:Xaa-Pro aminopeptidase
MSLFAERRRRLLDRMAQDGLESLIVTDRLNLRYLSGFTGSHGALCISSEETVMVTDGRYAEQASREALGVRVEITREAPTKVLGKYAHDRGWRSVGAEAEHLSWVQQQELSEEVGEGILKSTKGLVESLRLVKDETEIEALRRAGRLVDEVYQEIVRTLRPGMKEREAAGRIAYEFMRRGARGVSFESIVASGPRSSLPHGVASEKEIEAGELVVLDFGCHIGGYASDFTRTVAIGEPNAEQRRIHGIVLDAQRAAREAARSGLISRELDAVARRVIEKAGEGERFTHSLGHGLGMAVHEEPRLSETSDTVLQPGMVVTIEPGIYIPGWGGVRIEDTVVIGDNGAESLTSSPRDLMNTEKGT